MCVIPGDRMAEAMRDESQRLDVMAKTLNSIDAFFAPHLARAEAQSRKIAEAARLAREAEAEDGYVEPWSAQP